MKVKLFSAVILAFLLGACGDDAIKTVDEMVDNGADAFCKTINAKGAKIFTLLADKKTLVAKGTIGTDTVNEFGALLKAHPAINRIDITSIDGSCDDEANFKLMQAVYTNKVHTHLVDGGLIASGGTDLFLAGTKRTIGQNTQIGVHSWSMGDKTAKDFPKGNAVHEQYISAYMSVGHSRKWAQDFYYFTIDMATAEGMYYLKPADIVKYAITTH